MKKIMIVGLIAIVISCKKKEVDPAPTPVVCETKTKVFEGKYVKNNTTDTITISYKSNMCPTENSNKYEVYGLGKVINSVSTNTVDPDKVYTIISNETSNSAATSGVNCNWGLGPVLSVNYIGVGTLTFKKI